jgi:periplasmic divalent cation tolerance protein
MQLIEIRINCPDRATAMRIAERLLEARLAPVANIGSAIDSIYRWRSAVERRSEIPLIVRTRARHFDAIAAEVTALHPYAVPSIIATEIAAAAPAYRDWILAETIP